MSAQVLIQVALMAFVLLAPTMMVAVLVSGLSRRAGAVEPERAEALSPEPVAAGSGDEPGAHLGGLLVPDRVPVSV